VAPGVAIFVTVGLLNVLGEAIRRRYEEERA
jgi:ABC-type dipeptide/oligopeptide/nickel transport system permease subunit